MSNSYRFGREDFDPTPPPEEKPADQEEDSPDEGIDYDQKPDNVKDHMSYVEKEYIDTVKGLAESRRNADILRAERAALVDYTDRFFYDLKNDLMSGALQRLKELNIAINNQKDENAQLQKEIVTLKKEMSQTQQLVIMVNKRVTNVAEAVGKYERNKKPKKKVGGMTMTMTKTSK